MPLDCSSPSIQKRTLSLSIGSQFHFADERVKTGKMLYTCLLCMYTLGTWSLCENCTVVDEFDEKYGLCNPCKSRRGYIVQIKDCNSYLEEICAFYRRGFLFSNCLYDKCDQWENTYLGMIGKNPK